MCFSKQPATFAMFLLLALLMLSYGVGNVHCIHENGTDLHSLLDFKQGVMSDPKGALSSWNPNTHYCRWKHVNCTQKHPWRVSGLNLTGQSLSGSITTSLGNLTFLKTLDLSVNSFSGQIPSLDRLQRLEILYLGSNSLTGVIPDTLTNCSNLLALDLSGNMLTGAIPPEIGLLSNLQGLLLSGNMLTGATPPEIGLLSNLQGLQLSGNMLTGAIPPKIGLLSNLLLLDLASNNFNGTIPPTLKNNTLLIYLSLQTNKLEGSIPDGLWQLPNVQALFLAENRLSGTLPSALPNQTSLEVLDLHSNMLGKMLPSNIGDALSSLRLLDIHQNMFEGHIPASLGNATNLSSIDLSENYFTGQIPNCFSKLVGLNYLNLQINKLGAEGKQNWQFLETLSNCKLLQSFSLFNNQLQGVVPDSLGKLPKGLNILDLSTNNISGPVPSSIRNLVGLNMLDLSNNNFIGSIEEWAGSLTNLQGLNLEANNFVGLIPSSIGNLPLTTLTLSQNGFEGTIPPSIGNLPVLKLNLSYNKLQRNIPINLFSATTMTVCDLSYNNLEGPIPSEVSSLKQLTELRLSSNKISGEIPRSLSQCQELITIEFDLNMLTGNIPMSFGNLTTLSIVNLSHNDLSGLIPTNIGGIKPLASLDLSYNHLQGQIPFGGVFANATAVSLNGNWGLCGGLKDLHMPVCPSVSRRIEWKHYLTLIVIIVFGFMSLMMSVYTIFLGKKTSRRPYSFMISFGKKFPRFSYKDLAQATGNFSEFNLIGSGSYGSVYRGQMSQAKMQVAVKVFDLEIRFANKSFLSECEVLRTIRHRNLLPVLTACSAIDNRGNEFKALVYEFMHNGNLDTWLHPKIGDAAPKLLDLAQRIRIAVDVADALVYLHYDCGRRIVHCDVKPSNILLDDEMNAYLGDFGIASLLSDTRSATVGHSDSHCSVAVTGTIGYIPPEYALSVHASTCGDVYSFGIVLLEMLVGKRPTDSTFEGALGIVSFVERNCRDQILQIIDANLQQECRGFMQATLGTQNEAHRCLVSLVQVALSCTRLSPTERMNMREVAANLHSIRRSYGAAINREQGMLH